MTTKTSGFKELPNTADLALRVWADSLPELFAEAARGMNALAGAKPAQGPSVSRTFEADALDVESLLVAFLSELVWITEQENLVFDTFRVDLKDLKLKVIMSGGPILSVRKTIKAVTFHNLKVSQMDIGYQVEIVFDV